MNPSTAAAGTIVEALAALGVADVVLCPGSRSAPLAYAAAGSPDVRLHVRLDERSAGFVALGMALESGDPAAVVVTSGTAVANLHPAVLEASAAGVPLIVVSADRPHELRGIGANQVTDQVTIFSTALRLFVEFPAVDDVTAAHESGWRQQVSRLVAAARGRIGGSPGPVQLNVAFRDPLVPDRTPGPVVPGGLTRTETVVTEPVPVRLPAGPRTVVLAGHGSGATPLVVARAAGWPLLAEPSSGARMEDAIGPYRLLLDTPELGGRVQRVLMYGRPNLNRQVTRLLAREDVEVIAVSARPDWADPSGRAARVVPAVDPPLAGTGPEPVDGERPLAWLDAWIDAGEAVAKAVDDVLSAELAAGRLTGPLVAREVAHVTRAGDVLVAGSSNAVRDLDLACPPLPGAVRWIAGKRVKVEGAGRILANRGLAGIDGTVSTAVGVAQRVSSSGTGGRVRVLVGDLTLLHDTGGLLHGSLEDVPQLQVVVLDDGGGGIFSQLEHGARAELGEAENALFERFFATPQVADLAALCAGLGVAHERVDDVTRLRELLATPPSGLSVLQVVVDRGRRRELSARIAAAAASALGR